MSSPIARGALAGAAAGLGTSVPAYLLLEPVLDAAIALEGPVEGGPVSRTVQTFVGMPAGFVLTGIALGLLFGLAYRVLPSDDGTWRRSLSLAGGAFLALALVPQLRYPANPPGVGDPDTITTRTSAYLLAVVLGVVVVSAGLAVSRALARAGLAPHLRQISVVAGALVLVALGYALLPDSGDAVEVPATLLWDFRVRSLGLQALLYALLGTFFALLGLRQEQSDPVARQDALPV